MQTEQPNQSNKKIQYTTTATILFVIALIFIASTLRTPLTVVGPIISYIRDALGISNILAGFLTTIPLMAFAVVSPFAPRIARKFGMEQTLFYSVILLSIGIIIRTLGTTFLLIFGTILIGVAISFGNVLLSGFVKLKYPFHIGLLTGIYSVSMNISAGIGLGISQPIAANTSLGWQGSLGLPIILTVITLIVWIPLLRAEKVNLNSLYKDKNDVEKTLFKSPLAWAIAFSMGFQSFLFYCTTTWVPEILVSQGLSAATAGWMVSIMQYSIMPMTFLTPILAEKFISQRPIVFFFTFFYLVGFVGLLFEWSDYIIIWMICLGLAGGASFGACIMFFTLRTKTAYEASEISGFAQSIGYSLAAVGPVLFGFLYDLSNSWFIPNILFVLVTLILFIFSFISANNRYI